MVRLADLVRLLNGDPSGDLSTPINGAAALTEATKGDITFAAEAKFLQEAQNTQAAAIIVPRDFPELNKPVIRVSAPRLAWAKVLEVFAPQKDIPLGVHETARIGTDTVLGDNVSVQAHAYIGERVKLGDRVVVYPGVYIGNDVEIGDDTIIYAHVVIRERVSIGRRCILHPGAVLGADGFGFVTTPQGHYKVPHIGTVIIEDDVEIGANTTIDRGTTGATHIGRGTKIDNLVQVGHNVQIGAKCLIVALTGIAGSSILCDSVTMAGQSGIAGHLTVGENSVVMSRGLVASSLDANSVVSGFPARPHTENMRILAEERRLPALRKTVNAMQKQLNGALTTGEHTAMDVCELERKVEQMTAVNEQLKERLANLERAINRKTSPAGREGV